MSKANTKANINANIKTNGNQGITGAILNSVLNTMVDDYADEAKVTNLESEVSDIDKQINGVEIDETYVGTSSSSYKQYAITLVVGTYNYEITDSGDAVYFLDSSNNNVFNLTKNTSGTKTISADVASRVVKLSIFKGQIHLSMSDTANAIETRLGKVETFTKEDTKTTKRGSYYQTFVKDLYKDVPYRFTLKSSSSSSVVFYGLVDKTNTSNTKYLFTLKVGESTLFAPSVNLEALYYGVNGSCEVEIEDYNGAYSTKENHIFFCGANRTITKLSEAIQKAELYMDSVLYVDDGEYDLVTELGSDYFNSITSTDTMSGLVLKNRIKIVFSPNAKVVCNYSGSNQYVRSLFSPFNAGQFGFELINLNLECSNVRYCVHDERNGEREQMRSWYRDCRMKINNTNNPNWSSASCIGGGLGANHSVHIDSCVFEAIGATEGTGIYYHNSNSVNVDFSNSVVMVSNYCNNCKIHIQDTRTDATKITHYNISNNHATRVVVENTNPYAVVRSWNNDLSA